MRFLKLSIRHKLTFTFMLIELLLIILFLTVVSEYTKKSITNFAVQENHKLLTKGSQVITGYLDRIDKASLIFYETKKNTSPLWVELKKHSFIDEDEIIQALNTTYETVDGIFQVNLMAINRNISYLYKNHILSKSGYDANILNLANAEFSTSGYVDSTHQSHSYGVQHFFKNQEKVISFHRYIYEIPQNTLLGKISIDIEYDYLEDLCADLYDMNNEELYIISLEDDQLIYSTDEIGEEDNHIGSWYENVKEKNQNGFETVNLKNDEFKGMLVFNEVKTDYLNWIIVKKIPESYLLRDTIQMLRVITYIGVAMLLITLLASMLISFHFTKPIVELLKKIQQIKSGNLEIEIASNRNDEYGKLYNQFGQMMTTINELIINKYKLEIENKSIELKALQAQINPHFLSNTLQLIGTEALMADDTNVYDLILKLNNILNYSMRTDENIVRVKDEIDYLSSYLDLQKNRFKDNYHFEINVNENVEDVMLPKMTLQPIIENSFLHGFVDIDRQKVLIITIKLIGEIMEIRVKDNGLGIKDSDIQQLNDSFDSSGPVNTDYSSIGLKNVYSRLFFRFDKDVSMKIAEHVLVGTEIIIRIDNVMCYKKGE